MDNASDSDSDDWEFEPLQAGHFLINGSDSMMKDSTFPKEPDFTSLSNNKVRFFLNCIFFVIFNVLSVFQLFVPYIIKHKDYKIIPKYIIAMVPAIVMLMMYVLYVKGYFAIYTYPR